MLSIPAVPVKVHVASCELLRVRLEATTHIKALLEQGGGASFNPARTTAQLTACPIRCYVDRPPDMTPSTHGLFDFHFSSKIPGER